MSDARKDGVIAIKLWRLEKQVDDLIEEKQELIDYLKEEIDKYEQSICKILKENDSGWGDIGFYEETRKLSDTYFKMKEILSKLEKE